MFVYSTCCFLHRCQTVNNILYANHIMWGAIFYVGSRLHVVDNCVWHVEFLSDFWTEPTFIDPWFPQYATNWFCVLQVTSQPLPVSLHSQEASWMDSTNCSDCSLLSSNWAHIIKCAASIPWTNNHGITCDHYFAVVDNGNHDHPQWSFRVPSAIFSITWTPWFSSSEVSYICVWAIQCYCRHIYAFCIMLVQITTTIIQYSTYGYQAITTHI